MFKLLQIRQVTFTNLSGQGKKEVGDEALLICKTLNLYAIIICSRLALPLAALTKQQTHAGDHHRAIASCNWITMSDAVLFARKAIS